MPPQVTGDVLLEPQPAHVTIDDVFDAMHADGQAVTSRDEQLVSLPAFQKLWPDRPDVVFEELARNAGEYGTLLRTMMT